MASNAGGKFQYPLSIFRKSVYLFFHEHDEVVCNICFQNFIEIPNPVPGSEIKKSVIILIYSIQELIYKKGIARCFIIYQSSKGVNLLL